MKPNVRPISGNTAECGCEIMGSYTPQAIEHCPLHAAAGEMRALLKQEVLRAERSLAANDPGARERARQFLLDARALLAKVEGRS